MQSNLPIIKKPRRWPWIVACFVCLVIGYVAGSGNHDTPVTNSGTTTQAVDQPTKTAPLPITKTWNVTQTFSGNGIKKTDNFTVGATWKLQWSCDPTKTNMDQYNVIIGIDGSDGAPINPAAINTICKTGNTSGETIERQGGNVYLDVNSEDNWTIKVLEQK